MGNICSYVGNLTTDVELKQTAQGVSVASFNIAVKRPHVKDVTDFFRVVAWRAQAEFVSRYFHKGDWICVSGYNQTGSYKKKVGGEEIEIGYVELKVEDVSFCGKTGSSAEQTPSEQQPSFTAPVMPHFEELGKDDDLPF